MSRQSKAYIKGVKVSERHGAGEWVQERLSSLILVPLTLWGLWSGWTMSGAGYVHKPSSRTALLTAIGLVCIALAALGVFFIVRLALGSAPLPAGFGA